MEYLGPLYGRMAAGFGIKLVGTVMDLAIPWILAHMIDEIVPTKDQRRILLWGVGMAVCAVIALLGNVIANRRASAVARDATRRIRHDLFDKIEHLSARQLDELGIPSLISRLTSDTYNVNQTIGRIQRLGVRAPILLTGGVIVTMLLDIRLSMVLIATLPLLALGVWLISKKGISLYAGVQQNVDKMVRTVRDDCHQSHDAAFVKLRPYGGSGVWRLLGEYGSDQAGKHHCLSDILYHYLKCHDVCE